MANVTVKITCKDGASLTAKGKPFDVGGHSFVAHRSIRWPHKCWSVTCAHSGLSLTTGHDTQRKAMEASYALATRMDNRNGPGAFSSQMDMVESGAKVTA